MNQNVFCSLNEPTWSQLDGLLNDIEAGRTPDAQKLPFLFRQVSKDLALARSRGFDMALIERLNALSLRTHQLMYGARRSSVARFGLFWTRDFPQAVRREWRSMTVSLGLFYGGALLCFVACLFFPDLPYYLMGYEEIEGMQEMYNPAHEIAGRPGGASDDLGMFGFYIYNNIGVAFRTFASGLVFGLGSLMFVGMNGIILGVVAGHLTNVGAANTFFPFVIGHGAPELTAICISGAAGFRLGWAVVAPGRRKRAEALMLTAREVLPLIYGATGLLVIAAYMEGFWSASAVPKLVKYGVGAMAWVVLTAYLGLAGRRSKHAA